MPKARMTSAQIVEALEGKGTLSNPLTVKVSLGCGCFSEAWTTQEIRDVVGIIRYDMGSKPGDEIQAYKDLERGLAKLRRFGFPTLETYGIKRFQGLPDHYESGTRAWGLACRRMAASDRQDSEGHKNDTKFIKYLNENSIKDLEKMLDIVNRKRIAIGDFQVLIDFDGHLVIADTCWVYTRQTSKDMDEDGRKDIVRLLKLTRHKLEAQAKGDPIPDRIFGDWQR